MSAPARGGPAGSPVRRAVLAALMPAAMALLAMAPLAAAAAPKPAPRAALPIRASDTFETAPVMQLEGEPYLGANDLARLLGATKFWRSDVRKLVLRRDQHRLQLTVDNPFVLIDDHTVWLRVPVRSVRGELQVPVALLDSLPRDSTLSRLVFDARRNSVVALPGGGVVRGPAVVVTPSATRVTFPLERITEIAVSGRARNRFQVRIGGYYSGTLPDSTRPLGLVRALHVVPSAGGSAFEFEVSPDAAGWKLTRDDARVVLEFMADPGSGVEDFAPESPAGPRALRVVALDPGHGGADAGARSGNLVEKDLTMRLARALRVELERRFGARVVLTRDGDGAPTAEQRAETANRARADLVLSLHFDGYGSPRARGATAWCVPATFGAGRLDTGSRSQQPVDVVPWRDVATRWAVPSRALAEAVLSSLSLHGLGPVRLRERIPYPLLGVNAPGLMLECGTLTASGAAGAWSSDDAMRQLAAAIADGIDAYPEERVVMRRLVIVTLLLIIAVLALSRGAGCGRVGRLPPGAGADSATTGVRSARLYFGASDGDGLTLETRELMDTPGVHERVAALVAELDRGPRVGGIAVLPEGTYVLHAYLNDQGLLTLDLSRAFTQGFRGGSTSEWLAVASLIRTLGDNLPEVKRVLLVCGGAPIPTVGGHVALDRPLEVSEWP